MDNEITGFGEVKIADQIANQVFNENFKHLTKRLEKQESLSMNIILGSVVVVAVTTAGLIWGSYQFIGEYNQHYLQAEANFQKEMGELRKENFEFRLQLIENNAKTVNK